MEFETNDEERKRCQLIVTKYIKQVGIIKDAHGKLEILDSLFTFLAGSGSILLENKRFNEAVKKKLYNFYFNDCVTECIAWWRMIYNEDIHIHKVSTMPRVM